MFYKGKANLTFLTLPARFVQPAEAPEMAASDAEFFKVNEVNRLKITQNVVDRRLTTNLAAECLGISDR